MRIWACVSTNHPADWTCRWKWWICSVVGYPFAPFSTAGELNLAFLADGACYCLWWNSSFFQTIICMHFFYLIISFNDCYFINFLESWRFLISENLFFWNFFCSLNELVRDGENGMTFNNSAELATQILQWFEGFPRHEKRRQAMRDGIKAFRQVGWHSSWLETALPVLSTDQWRLNLAESNCPQFSAVTAFVKCWFHQ